MTQELSGMLQVSKHGLRLSASLFGNKQRNVIILPRLTWTPGLTVGCAWSKVLHSLSAGFCSPQRNIAEFSTTQTAPAHEGPCMRHWCNYRSVTQEGKSEGGQGVHQFWANGTISGLRSGSMPDSIQNLTLTFATLKNGNPNWAWWYTLVILPLKRQKQNKHQKFKATYGYIVSSKHLYSETLSQPANRQTNPKFAWEEHSGSKADRADSASSQAQKWSPELFQTERVSSRKGPQESQKKLSHSLQSGLFLIGSHLAPSYQPPGTILALEKFITTSSLACSC